MLYEFEDPKAVREHFNTDRIDVGPLLCFHEEDRKSHRKQLPSFISKDALMGVDFDIRLLDTAKSVRYRILLDAAKV